MSVSGARQESPEPASQELSWRERLNSASAYIVILSAAVFFYAMADQIPFDRVPGRIGPDAWPKTILALTIVACFWSAVRTILFPGAKGERAPTGEPRTESDEIDEREIYPARIWAVIVGTLAYIWILSVVGFFLSTLVFLFFTIYVAGYRRLLSLFLLSLCGSLFFMTIFVRVVYVSLPLGVPPFESVSLTLLALFNL